MPTPVTGPDGEPRRSLGLRVHHELRRRLKAVAAEQGLSMEDKLHQILCKNLGRTDLLKSTIGTVQGRKPSRRPANAGA